MVHDPLWFCWLQLLAESWCKRNYFPIRQVPPLRRRWKSYSSLYGVHSGNNVQCLRWQRRRCGVRWSTRDTSASTGKTARKKGPEIYPSSTCSFDIWNKKTMPGRQGAVQHWTFDGDGWRLWWTWMPLPSIWCTQRVVYGVTYLLERAVGCSAVETTSIHLKTPQCVLLWSSRGRRNLSFTCSQAHIHVCYILETLGRCWRIPSRRNISLLLEFLYFSVMITCKRCLWMQRDTWSPVPFLLPPSAKLLKRCNHVCLRINLLSQTSS